MCQLDLGIQTETREISRPRHARAPREPLFCAQFDLFDQRRRPIAPPLSHRERVRARARELYAEGKSFREIRDQLVRERLNRGARWSLSHARAFALSRPAPPKPPKVDRRVLSDDEVSAVRRLFRRMTGPELCKKFNISRAYLHYLVRYKRRALFD